MERRLLVDAGYPLRNFEQMVVLYGGKLLRKYTRPTMASTSFGIEWLLEGKPKGVIGCEVCLLWFRRRNLLSWVSCKSIAIGGGLNGTKITLAQSFHLPISLSLLINLPGKGKQLLVASQKKNQTVCLGN